MNTPICDFVREYCRSDALRLHMPGHKGMGPLGFEHLDLTEMEGADDLYHPDGIIAESEAIASALFGCRTFYSTEGSSQCIRAMVFLVCQYARLTGKRPLIAAGRNAHKTFLSAAALADAEVVWLYPQEGDSHLSCRLSGEEIALALDQMEHMPAALYLTSPDYLGNITDISAAANVCRERGVLLMVDNAHGAYLRFLEPSLHPADLGADLCCDSAHKTLPVITGGAYLHIGANAPGFFVRQAKEAMAMFGSTSPSYLILQSLDGANQYLAEDYRASLAGFLEQVRAAKERLRAAGYRFCGDEPMKLTLDAKARGYHGTDLAALLSRQGLYCEFADPDYLVLMVTPQTGPEGLQRLETALTGIPQRPALPRNSVPCCRPEQVISPREAAFAPSQTLPVELCLGRILASANVSCPPAVPIVCCGERIDQQAMECFAHYGITHCTVVI